MNIYLSDIQCPKIKKIDEDGNESIVAISYKIKYIDNSSAMTSSLSNYYQYLAEEFYKIKCKDCDCFLEYESVKDNLIKQRCPSCDKDW